MNVLAFLALLVLLTVQKTAAENTTAVKLFVGVQARHSFIALIKDSPQQ